MEEEIYFDTTNDLVTTHFFIYKNKTFPFNINSFKCVSRYFNSNQPQPEENTNIELLDESEKDITLDESLINDFINFFHMKKIILNKQNVFPLHKLAKKFIIPSLFKATETFITSHREELVIEFFLMKNNQQNFNSEKYEEIISNNITDFIEDEKLLTLPFPALHRIVTKYQLKNNTLEEPSKFIEFLFKCLDRFGKKASVLFDHFDFGKSNISVIRRLFDEYSEKFDFHFINAIHLKTACMLESELIEKNKIIEKQNILIEKLKNLFISDEIEEIIKMANKKIEYKGDKLNGIIKYLGGGDANKVINEGIMDVKCSSEYNSPVWNMKCVFDFNDSRKGFCSDNEPNSWFCYDFKERKVILSHYSLQSHGYMEKKDYHLITWCIEGSNDFDSWFELDSRNEEKSVAAPNKTNIFEITKNRTKYFRYIRIRQTGVSTSNDYWLAFSAIEFFGNILEP